MLQSSVDVYIGLGLAGAREAHERGGVVVMIDALRASATIVTALATGMSAVKIVATEEECAGEVTAGERGGKKLPHVLLGNSPTELARRDFRGKTLVLTTTNGAGVLLAATGPRTVVLVGTALNAHAVGRAARRLAQERGQPITLVEAGREGEYAIEDALAAGVIVRAIDEAAAGEHLASSPGDLARDAVTRTCLYGGPLPAVAALEPAFHASESGQTLVALGYAEDVAFCASTDIYDVVPWYHDGLIVPIAGC